MYDNNVLSIINNHIVDYPVPLNLSYGWSFGSLSGLCLVLQLISGVFLSMHYCANVDYAFDSIEHIMSDVSGGWLVRYLHSNGAAFFFIVVYIHLFSGLYYGSYLYPSSSLWVSGVVILIMMIVTAFLGYVLPYGQMSYWAATVITNLVTAVPLVGGAILEFLLGDYSVSEVTLGSFYSFHYILPFVISGLSLVHLSLLHVDGSSNSLGIDSEVSKISFFPYCYVNDLFVLIVLMIFMGYIVHFEPNVLGHVDNYLNADSLETPDHIVPEFYFLTFYAILRAVPHNLGGVVLMLLAILSLLLLPYLNGGEVRSSYFKPLSSNVSWLFLIVSLLLGWIGQNEAISPYIEIGQGLSVSYFICILVLIPLSSLGDKWLSSS